MSRAGTGGGPRRPVALLAGPCTQQWAAIVPRFWVAASSVAADPALVRTRADGVRTG